MEHRPADRCDQTALVEKDGGFEGQVFDTSRTDAGTDCQLDEVVEYRITRDPESGARMAMEPEPEKHGIARSERLELIVPFGRRVTLGPKATPPTRVELP
jgi:hypothetical protein